MDPVTTTDLLDPFHTPSAASLAASATSTSEPFMLWDGTCGPDPTLIYGAGPWVGIIVPTILSLIGGAATLVATARKKEYNGDTTCAKICFNSVIFNRFFCDVMGRFLAIGIVAAIIQTSLPETSIRAGFWGAFLGPHQGSVMALWQLRDDGAAIPTIIQLHAEMPLIFVGLAHIYLGERGDGPRIAVKAIRNPVLVGAWLYGGALIAVFCLNLLCRMISKKEWLSSPPARMVLGMAGLIALIAGLMLVIEGTQVCGVALGISDLLGAVFVAGLNLGSLACG